ncbi:hypothetical protein [Desulfobacterium sp. N47]|uniref:Uncharacterized protein n=1 Tax=uncultured Desulfobacterium sp. TaxID=201089 RepID=E1YA05_9BACT|nr:unknown protein [uncultured Desulfobacterium sp.]
MQNHKAPVWKLLQSVLSNHNLNESDMERIDEIHRIAVCKAEQTAEHCDKWSDAYEAALLKEIQVRQPQIQLILKYAAERGITA